MSNKPHQWKCEVCERLLSSAYSLKRHQNVHAEKQPCEYCGKPIKSLHRIDVLKKHLKSCKEYKRQMNIKQALEYENALLQNK